MGKMLFELACRQISLLEADYFGLEYKEQGSNVEVRRNVKEKNRSTEIEKRNYATFCVHFF